MDSSELDVGMFKSIDARNEESTVLSTMFLWVGQQLLALSASPGIALILSLVSALFSITWRQPVYLAFTFLGAIPLGYSVPKSPKSLRVARMTWIVPVVGFCCLLVREINQFGKAAAILAFFSTDPGDSESLATVFFTLPTWSAVAYSLGATLKGLKARS